MNPSENGREGVREDTVSKRTMELVVAALFMAVAALVMWENWRLGAGWASDGPEAGYFPFYIGLIMFIASAATFGINLFRRRRSGRTSSTARSSGWCFRCWCRRPSSCS